MGGWSAAVFFFGGSCHAWGFLYFGIIPSLYKMVPEPIVTSGGIITPINGVISLVF